MNKITTQDVLSQEKSQVFQSVLFQVKHLTFKPWKILKPGSIYSPCEFWRLIFLGDVFRTDINHCN